MTGRKVPMLVFFLGKFPSTHYFMSEMSSLTCLTLHLVCRMRVLDTDFSTLSNKACLFNLYFLHFSREEKDTEDEAGW